MCRPWCRPTKGRVHHNVRSTGATAGRNHCSPWSAPARPRRFAAVLWYRRGGGVGRTLVRVTETSHFAAVTVATASIPVRWFDELLARLGDVGVCGEQRKLLLLVTTERESATGKRKNCCEILHSQHELQRGEQVITVSSYITKHKLQTGVEVEASVMIFHTVSVK